MQRHVTEVAGHRIGWAEVGTGPEVVLVHGLGTGATWWTPTIPALSRSRRLLLVDLPGFGSSRGQAFRLDIAADLLAAWAHQVGLERVPFIGHSMGGLVVADLAARHPELVERLVLVDAAGLALPQRVSRHLHNLLRGGRYLPYSAYPVAIAAALRAGPLTIARAAHQILATDLAERLARIVAPTLVVWGERDTLLPVEFGRRTAATIPGARFVSIPDAGHSPMWEQPAIFERTVEGFLDEPMENVLRDRDEGAPPPTPHAIPTAVTASTGGRVRSRYLAVGDLMIHARVGRSEGTVDTPPIVLVHGFVISSRYHVPLMRRLAPNHLVFAPDLPGFGWSAKPSGVLDVPGLAAALVATMDAAGIGRAVLVGNSLGSQIVAQAAADHPDRVLATVLTGPTFDPAEPSLLGHAGRLVADIPREWPSLWLEHVPDLVLAGVRRAVRTLAHAWAHRIETVLPLVRVPSLVVRGAHDPLVPRTWASRAVGLLPNGRALEVARGGHAVQYGRPGAVARIVEDVVSAVSAGGRSGGEALPMHIVTATHRRRPAARPRRMRAGPPR